MNLTAFAHNRRMTLRQTCIAIPLLVLLAGCASLDSTTHPQAPSSTAAAIEVAEAFISEARPEDELDSLATWIDEGGGTRVIATAKTTHRLVLFDGDSGERLDAYGGRGDAPGAFRRPNGIATFGDLVFVTERDAPRVQVLRMPTLAPVATFGERELRSPYGIWLHETAPDVLDVYVTDSFMYGADHTRVPTPDELDQRVRRYRVELDEDGVHASALGHFGQTDGPGVLHIVESIAGDPVQGTLLIADEDRRAAPTLHEYALDGTFTGRSLPAAHFGGEPEGIALWTCGLDAGYWVAVDQVVPRTLFHVFERDSLAPRGSFHGRTTANTDGIALHAAATPRFPAGVLYAVHDDQAMTAFDLGQVARALGLAAACME